MLSENIRNYRKKNNLSQDELAEKVGVSRQSVSFWETGQTQPTIDNIIALTKIFHITSDMLLGNGDNTEAPQNELPANKPAKKSGKSGLIVAILIGAVILIGLIILAVALSRLAGPAGPSEGTGSTVFNEPLPSSSETPGSSTVTTTQTAPFDLFTYCKKFAIQKGNVNGDYCIYQQPSSKYGGYDNEYFSISYWSDSNMVEFCLHCPLSDTQSHNFYLRMRGGYNHKYEYASSKYYRDTGESLRFANGYIDPAVFSANYPIPCDVYEGSADGQTEFMEQSRVGICDLIQCLKQFVAVEKMECDFSDFEFVNF